MTFLPYLQATYYDDSRSGVLDGVINFVKGIFAKKEESESEESPALVKSLKPTVSIAVLEEKVQTTDFTCFLTLLTFGVYTLISFPSFRT